VGDRREEGLETLHFFKVRVEDISPGGRDWPAIEKSMTENREASYKYTPSESEICGLTELSFGPKGIVSPGYMVPK
jgi:hypothetical protein